MAKARDIMIWYKDWIFYVSTVVVVVCDQVTKSIIEEIVPLYGTYSELWIFSIVHGRNTGSAFGLFAGFTNFLIIASLLGLGLILYFFMKQATNNMFMRISVGLVVGGAFGNLIDRVKDGFVVDFISVGWWPAFNVADSAISVGMTVILAFMIFAKKEKNDAG